MDNLPIFNMHERHPGLTPVVAGYWCEAAYVCLDRNHTPPSDFDVEVDAAPSVVPVTWPKVEEPTRRAWNNQTDTVEAGGYAVALASVEMFRGLVAIGRAETGTGADYILGEAGTEHEDFEQGFRLEVSATESDREYVVQGRLRAKLRQLAAGKGNRSAVACVVGFSNRLIVSETFDPEGLEAVPR